MAVNIDSSSILTGSIWGGGRGGAGCTGFKKNDAGVR